MSIEPALLTKADVSELLQISPRQVENLVKAKRLPPPIRLGEHPRWRRDELLAFLNELTPKLSKHWRATSVNNPQQ